MFTKVFSVKHIKELLLLSLVLSLGLLCVYTPDYLPTRWGANHAPQIMFFYFFLGLGFYALNRPRYTFLSFGCCAALCLFLKESTHGQQVAYAIPSDQPELKVAHFNTANFYGDIDVMLERLINTDADILSIQGLDPMTEIYLQEGLAEAYPYQTLLSDLSFHGVGVLSKYHFVADTFYYEDLPNIFGQLQVQGYGDVYFVSSHTMPPLTKTDYLRNQAHLQSITENCKQLGAPLLAFGDYHLVPWSPEIRTFRANTALNDSRIGFTPSFIDGSINFLDIPEDHIFYSNHFECTSFSVMKTLEAPHIGIVGTFELKSEETQLTDASFPTSRLAQ
ncbi:MAG: endonuclease/exonuclease/phosphatase family protein [Bacteroidota bacterium]